MGEPTVPARDPTPTQLGAPAGYEYQDEDLYLEYINGGLVSTTLIAPMSLDDMRSTILSKDKKFSKGAVKVYGPDNVIMEVRDWVTLSKNNWLEKWRLYSSWYGADGERHSMDGMTGLLNFLKVVRINGTPGEAAALRAIVPFELAKYTRKPRKTRKSAAIEVE